MPDLTPTVLHTARLRLRWLAAGDAAAQFAIFSDPEVTRYWSSTPWTDIAQAEDYLARTRAAASDGSGLRFGLERDGRLIGNVSLFAISAQNRRCELGYVLARAFWGQGYLGEALGALLPYAFGELDMHRIEADVDPRNRASIGVLERAGFRREGYMPERWIVGGETADTVFYGLLRRDWEAR